MKWLLCSAALNQRSSEASLSSEWKKKPPTVRKNTSVTKDAASWQVHDANYLLSFPHRLDPVRGDQTMVVAHMRSPHI